MRAFGEQNDYGIMGSLFFAPTNVDFRPVNGVYPLPPSLGTNPLLAIDRIRNPQTIERFIGSAKATYTPITNLLLDYTIGIDNVGFEQRQFIPRNAVLGTAPIATGRAQSVFQNTRVINQDGVRSYTCDPMGAFELRTTAGFNFTSQHIRTTSATANGLAPVGELVSAGSVFNAAQNEVELRTLGFYAQQEVDWRNKLFVTAAVRYDASSTFARPSAGRPSRSFRRRTLCGKTSRGCSTTCVSGARSDGRAASPCVNALFAVHHVRQPALAGRPGFANDITLWQPRPA